MSDATDDSTRRTLAEARHRLANTLQLLGALARMRSQKATDPEARRQLLWLADAVGSLGGLEQRRGEGGVDFAAFLVEMTPIWRRRFSACQAEVTVDVVPLTAPDQAASTLALIAQELVGNALAHGFPDGRKGEIRVGLKDLANGRFELVVCDDGVGFDPASSASRERFGLWFVRSLATQVRGEFNLATQSGVSGSLIFTL